MPWWATQIYLKNGGRIFLNCVEWDLAIFSCQPPCGLSLLKTAACSEAHSLLRAVYLQRLDKVIVQTPHSFSMEQSSALLIGSSESPVKTTIVLILTPCPKYKSYVKISFSESPSQGTQPATATFTHYREHTHKKSINVLLKTSLP